VLDAMLEANAIEDMRPHPGPIGLWALNTEALFPDVLSQRREHWLVSAPVPIEPQDDHRRLTWAFWLFSGGTDIIAAPAPPSRRGRGFTFARSDP
jgi:hypothetical protein